MTEQQKIDRGMQAASLLAHPLMVEALDAITDQCLRDFAEAAPDDMDKLREARLMLETADRFRKVFKNIVGEGKAAASRAEWKPQEIA